MQMIRCAACGRRYDYRQEGCCPHCGAYNRPPRQEWVGADGTIHHGENGARPRPGKVCYEEKTCYEDKQCFEEQTRKPGKKAASAAAQSGERVVKSFQKSFKTHSARRGTQNSGAVTGLIAFVLVFVLLIIRASGLLDKIFQGDDDRNNGGWSDSNDDWNSDYRDIAADCGDEIDINDDLTIQFLGYVSGDNGLVYVLYWANDYDLARELLESGFIMLSDGAEDSGYPSSDVEDGYIIFSTDAPGTQWQNLIINGSTAGDRIIIRGLLPHEGADIMEYGIPSDASLAA